MHSFANAGSHSLSRNGHIIKSNIWRQWIEKQAPTYNGKWIVTRKCSYSLIHFILITLKSKVKWPPWIINFHCITFYPFWINICSSIGTGCGSPLVYVRCVTWFGTICSLKSESCSFTRSNTPPWVFFTFFKLYKWYQIAQSIITIYFDRLILNFYFALFL